MAKWPVLARNDHAATWLQAREDLGRAPGTLDAYARGLAEYLALCEREAVDPLSAGRTHVGVFVRELTSRPHRRGANVVSIESGAGLANATIQQRLVPVRLFYDFLIEEGLRESNPVARGRYTPGLRGSYQERGLVPRFSKLPWIPTERQWLDLLEMARREPVRNRVMLALAYDAALRREELCSLRTDDLDPAHRTVRVRAETTKNRLERVVPYSARTIEVLVDRDAVASGAAAAGEPWQHYDLGHGYCTYTFFEQRQHRMACARCDFYSPKDSTRAQLLEAKGNLQKMAVSIPLTEDEQAALTEGQTAIDELLGKLTDTPTPAGPTPRQITAPSTAQLLPIVGVRQGKATQA